MSEPERWPKPEPEELNGFDIDGEFDSYGVPFQAYQVDSDGYVIIRDCRLTKTGYGYRELMIASGFDPKGVDVLTLYLQGYILKKESGTESGEILTATGRCIYFLKNEADYTIGENELRIKKTAKFYYSVGVSTGIQEDEFGKLSNVATSVMIGGASSQRTNHPTIKGGI